MIIKKSLVSVLLPIHNAGRFLPQCINSLLRQSFSETEIIAVNDNSKDNSLNILKKIRKNHKNLRIIQNKKRYGQAICLNRAIRKARGQFLVFMNPNDYISNHKLKKQVNFLLSSPKTVAVGTQFVTINESIRSSRKSIMPLDHESISATLLSSMAVKPETVMINRMLIPKDILRFTTNKHPLIFTEVLIKLLRFGKFANLNMPLYTQRIGKMTASRRPAGIKHAWTFIKLILKARSLYDYHPSIRSSLPAMFRNI